MRWLKRGEKSQENQVEEIEQKLTEQNDIADMQEEIQYNNAKIWQLALFSMNNAATNLYLALMGYVTYYANGIVGLGVFLLSMVLTVMRVFDGITDPVI